MIQIDDKSGYMGQYLGEVNFCDGESLWFDMDGTENLRKIKFRLGSLIMSFNELEAEIEYVLCDWFDGGRSDSTGMIVVSTMGYTQKVTLLESYLLCLDNGCNNKKHLKQIKKLSKDLRLAGKLRNACVHAHRHTQNSSYVKINHKCDENGIKITYRKIDEYILDEYISFIENTSSKLFSLNEMLHGSLYN